MWGHLLTRSREVGVISWKAGDFGADSILDEEEGRMVTRDTEKERNGRHGKFLVLHKFSRYSLKMENCFE